MNTPTEHDFIDKCKHLIECRLEWPVSSAWKNRDYEYLSELLYEKTKISISVSTLKRIWKKDRQMVPHVSTLNALAVFLDYDSWNDFKSMLKSEIKPVDVPDVYQSRRKKSVLIVWVIIISTMMILLIGFISVKSLKIKKLHHYKLEDIVFTSKKTVTSGLPNSVVFRYDISGLDFDSAFIQQDWDKRRRTKISGDNHYHTCIYYYPGYYNARLVINDQEVKKFPLFITTDGWIAVYKKEYHQEIPVYLKNIQLIKNKQLHVSVEDLESNKIINDKDFFVGFYNARDFGEVYCDSFSFETEIKNNPKDGGLTCQFASITVEGEAGMMTSSFSEPGCTSKLFLEFGNTYVDGSKNDLSGFGMNMNEWRKIRYNVVNRQVEILVDDRKIQKLSYSRDIGKIIGISYYFYGCGAVKSVKLFDKTDKLIYTDEF